MPQCIIIIIIIIIITIIIIRQFLCYTKTTYQSICSPSARTVKVLKAYLYPTVHTVDVTEPPCCMLLKFVLLSHFYIPVTLHVTLYTLCNTITSVFS